MKFRIETKLNDTDKCLKCGGLLTAGPYHCTCLKPTVKAEAPAFEVEVFEPNKRDVENFRDVILDEMIADNGQFLGPGFTLTIERVE